MSGSVSLFTGNGFANLFSSNSMARPRPMLAMKKHKSLYMADGNVVLCATNDAADFISFCVHRTMLSRVSPVFADMFKPPSANTNELYEGLPVVYMPDKAEDWELLLKVLYHEIELPMKRLDPNAPLAIKPILSLANKYDIDHLKNHIVERITHDWGTSLSSWDTLDLEIRNMKRWWHSSHPHTGHSLDCPTFMDAHLPEPVSAINLAQECGVRDILPAAFYHLSRLSLKWGVDGSETDQTAQSIELYCGERTARWKSLAGEDYYKLLIGRDALREAVAASIDMWPTNFHVDDPGDEQDEEAMDDCNDEFSASIRSGLCNTEDVLYDARRFIEILEDGGHNEMCGRCITGNVGVLTDLRKHIWSRLPQFFRLEPVVRATLSLFRGCPWSSCSVLSQN